VPGLVCGAKTGVAFNSHARGLVRDTKAFEFEFGVGFGVGVDAQRVASGRFGKTSIRALAGRHRKPRFWIDRASPRPMQGRAWSIFAMRASSRKDGIS